MHGALRRAVGMENPHDIAPPKLECPPFFFRCTSPCWSNSSLLPRTPTSSTRFNKETSLQIASQAPTESGDSPLSPSRALPAMHGVPPARERNRNSMCYNIGSNRPNAVRMPSILLMTLCKSAPHDTRSPSPRSWNGKPTCFSPTEARMPAAFPQT